MLDTFNIYLFVQFVIYIAVLLLAFKIKEKEKYKLNKKYKLYKPYLTILLFAIFGLSSIIMLLTSLVYYMFAIFFIGNMLFISYFLLQMHHNTRCWKQHRMVYYNFILIPLAYIFTMIAPGVEILAQFLFILICAYTILEFQFAKFNLQQTLMWD